MLMINTESKKQNNTVTKQVCTNSQTKEGKTVVSNPALGQGKNKSK